MSVFLSLLVFTHIFLPWASLFSPLQLCWISLGLSLSPSLLSSIPPLLFSFLLPFLPFLIFFLPISFLLIWKAKRQRGETERGWRERRKRRDRERHQGWGKLKPGLGWPETRSWGSNLNFPHGWKGPYCLSHPVSPRVRICRKLGVVEQKWDSCSCTLTWDRSILTLGSFGYYVCPRPQPFPAPGWGSRDCPLSESAICPFLLYFLQKLRRGAPESSWNYISRKKLCLD